MRRVAGLIVRIVLCSSLAAMMSAAAQADELVEFERDYKGEDLEFVAHYLYETFDSKDFFTEGHLNLVDNVEVGHYDVNDDGIPELFIRIHGRVLTCGTVGCDTLVFQKIGREWLLIGDLSSTHVEVSGEKVQGYRTIYSSFFGLRWDGSKYRDFCVWDCSDG